MRRQPNRPARPNATGRSDKTARFSMMPHRLMESAAYGSLDLVARCVLAELLMLWNSRNNGSLYLSVKDATARLGMSDDKAVSRAFDDLVDRGFIEVAKEAHFAIKASDTSRARCWRLTWEAWPECPVKSRRTPTNDWQRYVPDAKTRANTRADRRLRALARYRSNLAEGKMPVVDSPTTPPKSALKLPVAVEDSTTGSPKIDANQPIVVVGDSTLYIDVTRRMLAERKLKPCPDDCLPWAAHRRQIAGLAA